MAYTSHLSFIKTVAAQSSNQLLFKLPLLADALKSSELNSASEGRTILGWKEITYSQFLGDVEWLARYWLKVLGYADGRGLTVGLWMGGMTYTDTVHLFSLMRAGFVPHILELNFQATDIVVDLFTETHVSAIICAPTAPTSSLIRSGFKVHTIIALDELVDNALDDTPLPSDMQGQAGGDIIMMYHTSGSTSGRPKIVKFTRQWMDINAKKDLPTIPDGKEVALRLGTFSHTAQLLVALLQMKNAGCIVLTPWNDFTPHEVLQIIKECQINTIHQYSGFLNRLLRVAATNPELKSALKSLKFVAHTGSSLGEEESKWAVEHGIHLKNLFGSTEAGYLMASLVDDEILYPLQPPGIKYEFWPVDETRVGFTRSGLVELVIPRVSLDCPQPSFCDPIGGHYRSKDLFEEVHPGAYKYRGRLDDMIKMENASLCDTKYIEDRVSKSCKDLISCCIVVGSNRPSPVLLVEPLSDDTDKTKLKEEIGEKVQLINQNSYSQEQIKPSHILIVPCGGLPRTSSESEKRFLQAGRKP